ncbi:hypothetical protein [Paraburkholderia nodosa]|uniref:hypothetical protein n=1 Tax=Paraburkholderia nodosa TaxID=392320 RepID=UPI000489340D|nr:hypothetical protein [Paraburkholderia nodosa]
MVQKFTGEVGQVAGRDVKSSNAQANVNIHLHSGEESKRYISDRQRRAIAAKVFELEERTGVEKLIVYRRLMTCFKFQSMDELPRDLFERVMRYLDGWLRNGTADQAAPPPALSEGGESIPAVSSPIAPAHHQPGFAASVPAAAHSPFAPLPKHTMQIPWLPICLAVIASMGVFAAVAWVVHRSSHETQPQTVTPTPHCEYAGTRYTIGSIVRQEGLRQRCAATGNHPAEWQPLASGGRD